MTKILLIALAFSALTTGIVHAKAAQARADDAAGRFDFPA